VITASTVGIATKRRRKVKNHMRKKLRVPLHLLRTYREPNLTKKLRASSYPAQQMKAI
jgi:hypothetical protein